MEGGGDCTVCRHFDAVGINSLSYMNKEQQKRWKQVLLVWLNFFSTSCVPGTPKHPTPWATYVLEEWVLGWASRASFCPLPLPRDRDSDSGAWSSTPPESLPGGLGLSAQLERGRLNFTTHPEETKPQWMPLHTRIAIAEKQTNKKKPTPKQNGKCWQRYIEIETLRTAGGNVK